MPEISSFFFFSSRRRHTRCLSDWSSDVCSSDLSKSPRPHPPPPARPEKCRSPLRTGVSKDWCSPRTESPPEPQPHRAAECGLIAFVHYRRQIVYIKPALHFGLKLPGSSSRFRFSPSPPAAPDIGLDRSGHLFRSIDRAQDAAVPDVFVGLCQPGINNAALCRGVFIIGVGKLGAVNPQLGCEHHLAAFGYADRGAETAGNVIWPLRWILTRVVTKQKFPSVRKSESRTSEESIAVLALAS